jgi:lipopolysaccharide/colanic/teichoic acid biosynthesis glycosyltransferase
MIYMRLIKPFLDRTTALLLILVTGPFWLVFYGILYLSQGRPVIFCQARSGRRMKTFTLYKIRTLQPTSRTDLSLSERSHTFFGKWLRTSGIDELPQLINILKGEMSFVGPRALPVAYEVHYSEEEKRRFSCLPGITGWAQVHGGNSISWSRRFEFDLWYIKHVDFLIDCKIVMLTLLQCWRGGKKEVHMPVFSGTNPN